MSKRRSPIRVGECFDWPFKPRRADDPRKVCKWVCDREPRAAEFVQRNDATRTAVLHPSTKKRGYWQVSFFDKHGAVMDTGGATCTKALDNAGITPSAWKLKAVE